MRRFIEDFKMKNIAFFLLFFLLVSGHSNANAVGGSIGGWNVVSNVASGIGAKITASKEVLVNGAKTTVTGTANIMPDPSNMGKFMARLGGAAIVSEALNQILDGVDYVMDPANNTVTYHKKPDSSASSDPYHPTNPTIYYNNQNHSLVATTPEGVCKLSGFTYVKDRTWDWCYAANGGRDQVQSKPNPYYVPNSVPESKPITVPISDVASQVLD